MSHQATKSTNPLHHENIIPEVFERPDQRPNQKLLSLHQKSSKEPSPPRSNPNHLPLSRILQNRTYFTSKSTILSHLLDSFNSQLGSSEIDRDIKSKSPHISIQHFANIPTSKLSSLLESQSESLPVGPYISVFLSCLSDSLSIDPEGCSNHHHSSIATILLTRESFDILPIYLRNQHLSPVSVLDSIPSLQNSAPKTVAPETSRTF